jgi:phi13 family phage major tail protein
MVAQNEYKSAVGLKDLYIAKVTQDDAGGYIADTPEYFAPAINATAEPAVNSKIQYADDQPFDAMSAEGETKITLDVTEIPLSVQASINGSVFDVATGRMFDNAGVPDYFALGFKSQKSNGSYKFYWFLKGRFQKPKDDKSTKTDTPDPKATQIIFSAIKTVHPFDLLGDASLMDGAKRVVGDEDLSGFDGDTWFDAVQTPLAGSPGAFTLSSLPADGATGVVVSANLVLTFSNALMANAEEGIILVRSDTQAPIACARTLDAARKVVTLDPNSNLTSAKTYLVIVAGVKDVYGQVLTDTVIDITTA